MNPRNTLIMLVLVLGLGSFWYFHDVKGGQQRDEARTQEESVFPGLEEDQLVWLRLTDLEDSRKTPLWLEKVEGRWTIRGQRPVLAAQDEVAGLAAQLATLRRESVIAEAPGTEALAQYGLDKPRYRLEVGTSKSQAPLALLLGQKTPDDTAYYARSGQAGPVLEVNAAFMESLEKPVSDLREKSPLALDPGAATRVVLQPASGPQIVLVREQPSKPEGGQEEPGSPDPAQTWRLQSPVQAPADPRQVSEFLWAWKSLTTVRFMARDEKVDFSRPELRIEVTGKAGSSPVILEVGPRVAVKPGMAYLRRSAPEEGLVVDLGEQAASLVGRTAQDFEDHHLLPFAEDAVDRLELTLGPRKVQARRIRDGWEITAPEELTRDAAQRDSAVSDLVFDARDLEWVSRGGSGAPARIENPRASLKLLDKSGQTLGSLAVGGPTAGGGAWVATESSETVFSVAKDPIARWQEILHRLQGAPPGASPSPH